MAGFHGAMPLSEQERDQASDITRELVTEALNYASHATSRDGETALAQEVFAGGLTALAIYVWKCRQPNMSFDDAANMFSDAVRGMMPQVAAHCDGQQGGKP